MARYLVASRASGSHEPVPARLSNLEVIFETANLLALAEPGTGHLSLGKHGVIFGTLFHRHGPAKPIVSLDVADILQIVSSRGASLLEDYWGGYVAVIVDQASPLILRDPSGGLPCYIASVGQSFLAGSDVDILLSSGRVQSSIDWDALAVHLYSAGLPTFETVLTGIEELLPGFSLDLCEPSAGQRPCWSPWDHVSNEQPDDAASVERLRRTIIHSVRSWASQYDRVVLSVSGGLDSSIIAACLAAPGGPEVHCLTMYGDDAGGDERVHARTLCKALGLPLTECRYRVEDVDIDAPLGGHLPRPFGRTQSNAYERAHIELARELRADAFVTGNGGDNVFAYSQSAAAIADRLLSRGLGAGVLATLRDVSGQTGCSIFEAVAATGRILRAPRRYRWRPSDSFLHPSLRERLSSRELNHPWLEAPSDGLPGKAGHIAGILRVQPNLEPGRSRVAPVLNPLVSQPIMQACLAIPSWRWREGGSDRAVARAAFRNDLPDAIVARRSKGGPDAFTAQLIAHYRPLVRERLLEGNLAANRIVDVEAVARVLSDTRPTLGEERTRLLALLSTEAWLRYWRGRLASLNQPPGRRAAV